MGTRTYPIKTGMCVNADVEAGNVVVEIDDSGDTTRLTVRGDREYRFDVDRDVAVTDRALDDLPEWVEPLLQRLGLSGVQAR